MKKSVLLYIFFSVLSALLLSSCTPAESAPQPEPVVVSTAKTPLTPICSITPDAVPQMLSKSDGRAILCWCDYALGITNLVELDAANDAVIKKIQLQGEYDIVEESFDDGGFALRNFEDKKLCFYNKDFRLVSEFFTNDIWGKFSHDGQYYYFIRDNALYAANTLSGTAEKVTLPRELRLNDISAMHPTKNQLAVSFIVSPFSKKSATAIIDLDNGDFVALQSELYQPRPMADSFALLSFDEEYMRYGVAYAHNGGYNAAPASLFRQGELVAVANTEYMLGVNENDTHIYLFEDDIKYAALSKYGIKGYVHLGKSIGENKLLIGTYADDGFNMFILNCDDIDFSFLGTPQRVDSPFYVDLSLADAYWGALMGEPLPKNLGEVRQYADMLEQAYNVKILLGEQCQEPASLSWYAIDMTDGLYADATEEAVAIYRTLEALDRCLALYPTGFFAQFANPLDEGGLCFLLVGTIQSDIGAVGLCYENYEYNFIALDVSADNMDGTVCHEIWHACENKIMSNGYDGFYIDAWQKLNPENFDYFYIPENYAKDDTRWTFFGNEPLDDVYFIDNYSRYDPREDRARIMEYVMSMDDFSSEICKSPNIMAKLSTMCSALRTAFDLDGLQNLRWERFLPQG